MMHASRRVYGHLMLAEGLRLRAYKRRGDVWTIGYGRTRGVKDGDQCTELEARHWLDDDVAEAERVANGLVTKWKRTLTAGQFDCLVDMVYNFGGLKIARSTFAALMAEGHDGAAVAELPRWVHTKGRIEQGLVDRRKVDVTWFMEKAP